MTAPGSLVLCYHAVSEAWEHELSIGPALFERQLGSLVRRGFHGVSALDAPGGDRRGLHVTFDDAYTSVANALPILERLQIPATVYACTSYADDGRPLAVPELADEAAAHPDELATMGWDGLRSIAERGVEIGSHTISHPHLPRLSDAELERELRDSKTQIEDELRRPCRVLAYPYGEHDARASKIAEQAGYNAAYSLASQPKAGDNPRFVLPRVDLYRRDGVLLTTMKTSALRRPAVSLLDFVRRRGEPS